MNYHGYRLLMLALFGSSGQPPEWRMQAACTTTDPGDFYNPKQIKAAKDICEGCPVLAECRRDQLGWESAKASRRYYPAGVVGGMSAPERKNVYYPGRRGVA